MKLVVRRHAVVAAASLAGLWCGAAFGQEPFNHFKIMEAAEAQRLQAVRVVGRVSEVWVKDSRYEAFHADLQKQFSGVPTLDAFKADEQWITLVTSRSHLFPALFKGRSATKDALAVGDIVEMRAQAPGAKTYEQLGQVTAVLCRASQQDYSECASKNPLAWFAADGSSIKQPLQARVAP